MADIGEIQGNNLFQYCFNNPVNMYDDTGEWPKWIVNIFGGKKKIEALKPAEQKFVYKYPFAANTFQKCANKALAKTQEWFKDSSDGTWANSFQHAYWNALMVFRVDRNKASQFANAHEDYSEAELNGTGIGGLSVRDLTNMDLYNNWVGREIGQLYKNAYNAKSKSVYIMGGSWKINRKDPEGDLANICWWAAYAGYTYWLR